MRFIQFILSNLLRFKYLGILLLALLPTVFLNQTPVDNYQPQAIYMLAAVFCFLLFSVRFTSQISCLIVLSLFYNFLFLHYKNDLFIEFLFMAFFYSTVHLILLNRRNLRYVIPVLIAMVLMLKPIGIALLLAYVGYLVVFRLQTKKQKFLETGLVLLLAALTVFVFYRCLPQGMIRYVWNMSGYAELAQQHWDTVLAKLLFNVKLYPGCILNFFEQDLPGFIVVTIQVVSVLMFFIGLYFSLKNQFGFIDTVFLAYVMGLVLIPCNAFRQLMPIMPLLFYYMANSILSASNFLVLYLQHRFAIWFFVILLLGNAYSIWLMYGA